MQTLLHFEFLDPIIYTDPHEEACTARYNDGPFLALSPLLQLLFRVSEFMYCFWPSLYIATLLLTNKLFRAPL